MSFLQNTKLQVSRTIQEGNAADSRRFLSLGISNLWNSFTKESLAFWCFCGYIVFEYVRPQALYPWLNVLPWAQMLILASAGFAFGDKTCKWPKNALNVLMLTFLAVVFVSSALAYKPALALSNITDVASWILIYFIGTSIVNTERRFFFLLLIYLLANYKMSQHGFLSWASRGFSFARYGLTGAPAWFRNSGEFGIQMLMILPLSLAFYIALRHYWSRLWRIFFFWLPVTALGVIIGCSSRGAQSALAATALIFVLRSNTYRLRAIAGLVIVGSLVYWLFPEKQMERFASAGEDGTSLDRLRYWSKALVVMKEHPFFGVGYDNWPIYAWDRWGEEIFTSTPMAMHNTVLQASSELGFIGLIVYLLIVVFNFVNTAKARRILDNHPTHKWLNTVSHGLDYGLIGYLVSSFFISTLYYPYIWIHSVLTASLLTTAYNIALASSPSAGALRNRLTAAMVTSHVTEQIRERT